MKIKTKCDIDKDFKNHINNNKDWNKRFIEVEELIKELKSKDWLIISNGRSTDFLDEIMIDDSIENLITKLTPVTLDQENDKMVNEELRNELKERNKSSWFVGHIQNHLNNHDMGNKAKYITPMKVGCAICDKDIDQIAEDVICDIEKELSKIQSKKS